MNKESLTAIVLYIILSVLVGTSTLYAKNAEKHAASVSKSLNKIDITAQNRCIIRVILSYPPPVSQEQFDQVLRDYDVCIIQETEER